MADESVTRRDFLGRLGPVAMGALGGLGLLTRVLGRPGQAQAEPAMGREIVRLAQTAMGCRFEVLLPEPEPWQVQAARESLRLAGALEDQLTIFRDDSEVSLLNRTAGYEPVRVEPGLFDLLSRSAGWSESLQGAFDPAAGVLSARWREAEQACVLPGEEEMVELLRLVGMRQLQLEPSDHSLRFARPGVLLDLGAVGKGYAVDRIAADLQERGVVDALVHAGHSSVYALGSPPWEEGWLVEVSDPQGIRPALATLRLCDRAMSTSAATYRQFQVDGRRWGHLLDPRTGWPAEGVLGVSALAPAAAEAEALSTGLFVLGPEQGAAVLAGWPEAAALFVLPGGRGVTLSAIGESFTWEEASEPSQA